MEARFFEDWNVGDEATTSGVFPAKGLVGLGVDKLRWVELVDPGDSLRVTTRVTSKRENAKKPTGIVQFENETRNQHGEIVMTHDTMVLMPRRPHA